MQIETIIKLEKAAQRHPIILQIAQSTKNKTITESEGMEMILSYLLDADEQAIRYQEGVNALLKKHHR